MDYVPLCKDFCSCLLGYCFMICSMFSPFGTCVSASNYLINEFTYAYRFVFFTLRLADWQISRSLSLKRAVCLTYTTLCGQMLILKCTNYDYSYLYVEIPDADADRLGYADQILYAWKTECCKCYHKNFNEGSKIDGLGFPVCRRHSNIRFVTRNGIYLNNWWAFPYNMALLKKIQAHNNVEWCSVAK
jgi:hypothetical protein